MSPLPLAAETVVAELQRLGPAAPLVVPDRVNHYPPDPGGDRPAAGVALTLAHGGGKAFVNRVSRRLAVAEDRRSDTQEAIEVAAIELLDLLETGAHPSL